MNNQIVAFVTGASRGIGIAISTELVAKGYFVIGVCRDASKTVAKEWEEKINDRGALYELDISDHVKVDAFFKDVMSSYATPYVLVNNAGTTDDAFFHKMTSEQWSNVIGVNLLSIFYITQPIYKDMIKQKKGRIVNISSVNGQKGQAGQVNYCVSKAGIVGFSKALALEGARSNVTVNTISPGYIDTRMTSVIGAEIKESIRQEIPQKRFGKPSEIAKAVSYLISEEAEYVTGQNICVNGGLYMS